MNAATTALLTVAGLAVGTWALRVAGVRMAHRAAPPPRVERVLAAGAVAVLAALAVTSTVHAPDGFAGPARVLAVGAAVVLAWRRAPLPVIVAVGAGGAALLRLAGLS